MANWHISVGAANWSRTLANRLHTHHKEKLVVAELSDTLAKPTLWGGEYKPSATVYTVHVLIMIKFLFISNHIWLKTYHLWIMSAMHLLPSFFYFTWYFFFGRGQVSIQKGKKKEPFRAAFSKVRDLQSFLPGVPILALTASVKLKDRASLWKACGMVNPLVVDVSPNKDNIYLGFEVIEVEAEALNRLKWVATMVEKRNPTNHNIFQDIWWHCQYH